MDMAKMSRSKKKVGWRIYGSFALVFLILCGLSLLAYKNAETLIFETQSIDTTSNFVYELQDLTASLRDAEMANNIYVLIGKERFREIYRQNVDQLSHQFRKVQALNPQVRETDLERLIQARIADMDHAMSEREQHGQNAALQVFLTGNWQKLADDIQRQIEYLRLHHNKVLKRQTLRQHQSTEKTFSSVLAVGGAVFLLFVMAMVVIRREMSQRLQYEDLVEQARDEAIQASHFKSQFLANMSHEIRTPMTGILGLTTALLEGDLSHEQKRNAGIIQNSCSALLRVINDILDLSKVEAGKLEICPETFDLKLLLTELEALFSTMAEKKKIDLLFESHEIPALVVGDSGRIRQICNNLIGNAIKFTSKGFVAVKASLIETSNRARIRFEISDTGVGIPWEAQKKIFGAFEQAEKTTGKRFGGTGLGLHISKRLVELMDGKIGFDSEPGHGSRFWFELEFAMAPAAKPVLQLMEMTEDHPSAHRASLLIADDNEINHEVLKVFLGPGNYNLEFASDGKEAVELIKNKKYDLVLMDVQMPGMDGLEATQLIRSWENEEHRGHTPILAFTAGVSEKEIATCRESGCDGYLEKPIEKKNVIRTVEKFLKEVS